MSLTKLAIVAAVAGCAAICAPRVSHADSIDTGTITINGKVIDQTCNVTGNGQGNDFTVTLPVVQANDLAESGDTAGDTSFTMELTDCPTTPTIQVGTQFYSSENANPAGRLDNIATDAPANNVDVELLDGDGAVIDVSSSQSDASVTNLSSLDANGEGLATLQYTARYHAVGEATAGNVSTTVEYAIHYQ